MRCMYSTAFSAHSYCTTCVTWLKSSPRDARPVHTSVCTLPSRKASRVARRSASGSSLWKSAQPFASPPSSSCTSSAVSGELVKTSFPPGGPCLIARRSACSRCDGSTFTKTWRSSAFSRCTRSPRSHTARGKSRPTCTSAFRVPAFGIVAPTTTNCFALLADAFQLAARALARSARAASSYPYAAAFRSAPSLSAACFASRLSCAMICSTG
mmetsp:Transcript_11589/g.28649  ORF Transcript_11589/g.28649 Transcript_11589/m.28649 type:complete len:212 (-) Transcript_11589:651-1286(-)